MDLRAMGRWCGEIMYIYARKCRSQLHGLQRTMATVDIDPWLHSSETWGTEAEEALAEDDEPESDLSDIESDDD